MEKLDLVECTRKIHEIIKTKGPSLAVDALTELLIVEQRADFPTSVLILSQIVAIEHARAEYAIARYNHLQTKLISFEGEIKEVYPDEGGLF